MSKFLKSSNNMLDVFICTLFLHLSVEVSHFNHKGSRKSFQAGWSYWELLCHLSKNIQDSVKYTRLSDIYKTRIFFAGWFYLSSGLTHWAAYHSWIGSAYCVTRWGGVMYPRVSFKFTPTLFLSQPLSFFNTWFGYIEFPQSPLGCSLIFRQAIRFNWIFHPSSGYRTLCIFYSLCFTVAGTSWVLTSPAFPSSRGTEPELVSQLSCS